MNDRPRHVFTLSDDGRAAVFSAAASGPWSPGHCHGGAVGALIAYVADAAPAPAPMQLARLTLELHRPVPTAEVAIERTVVREGRRLQLLDIRLSAEGTEVARASVLRLRTAGLDVPADMPAPAFAVSPPEAGTPGEIPAGMGFGSLFDLASVGGGFRTPGPASVWFRFGGAFAEGRPNLPAALACAVSDFSNGISSVLPFEQWSYINPDLTVNLAREPVGDWLLSDAETVVGPDGRAVARTRLADRQGWLGQATQSVLLDRR